MEETEFDTVGPEVEAPYRLIYSINGMELLQLVANQIVTKEEARVFLGLPEEIQG
jgi:hypothetical protein